ncbi:hypothetical protein GW17_00041578 [Ensete ventricosum]|nr:hypothetical protein GW17_00041578 [Ensete ventricosum]
MFSSYFVGNVAVGRVYKVHFVRAVKSVACDLFHSTRFLDHIHSKLLASAGPTLRDSCCRWRTPRVRGGGWWTILSSPALAISVSHDAPSFHDNGNSVSSQNFNDEKCKPTPLVDTRVCNPKGRSGSRLRVHAASPTVAGGPNVGRRPSAFCDFDGIPNCGPHLRVRGAL